MRQDDGTSSRAPFQSMGGSAGESEREEASEAEEAEEGRETRRRCRSSWMACCVTSESLRGLSVRGEREDDRWRGEKVISCAAKEGVKGTRQSLSKETQVKFR